MNRLFAAAALLTVSACTDAPVALDETPALLVGGSPSEVASVDYIKFETGPGTGVWTGRVSGSVNGGLQTQVLELTEHRHTWELRTRWEVFAIGDTRSFVAEMSGTLNLETGELRLAGRIVSGAFAGAAVFNRGQLTGIDPVAGGTVFGGSLRIVLSQGN